MQDIDQAPSGGRRRAYAPVTPDDVMRYETSSTLCSDWPLQLDGAIQFQVLHVAEVDEQGRADFLDVDTIGSSSTDTGAIRLVQEHHDASGESRAPWFLRGAGRSGEEIHAGYGHGLHSVTRYRIVMVRARNRQ